MLKFSWVSFSDVDILLPTMISVFTSVSKTSEASISRSLKASIMILVSLNSWWCVLQLLFLPRVSVQQEKKFRHENWKFLENFYPLFLLVRLLSQSIYKISGLSKWFLKLHIMNFKISHHSWEMDEAKPRKSTKKKFDIIHSIKRNLSRNLP